MSGLERVVVVGSSGSGKTTVARVLASRLDSPHLEMDSVFHRHGWAHATVHRLRSQSEVDDFLESLAISAGH